MIVAIYNTHHFERECLQRALQNQNELRFLDVRLTPETAALAKGCQAVVLFVHDQANREVLIQLNALGIKFIALRSAGFNHIHLPTAKELGMTVMRVPEYSPFAVAEHAVALILALNRKIHKACNRVRDLNFSLDGLVGFDLHGRTAGIVGTGRIGSQAARILHGFGCEVLVSDPIINPELAALENVTYTDFHHLCQQSDIITLHAPLNDATKYLINHDSISHMKKGVMIINTSRGGLLETKAVIKALKTGQIGNLGLDVYEEEDALFFEDHSQEILQDDVIARLLTFPNVLVTSHQAFLTSDALEKIASVTAHNLDCMVKGVSSGNEL